MDHANTSRAATIETILAITNGHTDCGCAHDRADVPVLRAANKAIDAENTRLRRRDYEMRATLANLASDLEMRAARAQTREGFAAREEFVNILRRFAAGMREVASVK